ncbi:MAG: hypothetical protein KJ077_49055 [Anaerolineae bacterium]|nr:hypothetical protein [Anaerolineae bacterium]
MEVSAIGANLLNWVRINWTFLLVVSIIAAAFIFLRSTPSQLDNLTQLNDLLVRGQPTVIEFYSNF